MHVKQTRFAGELFVPFATHAREALSCLEDQTQAVLYFAAIIGDELACDLAEVRARKVNSRVIEVDAVEGVVGFEARFQSETLCQPIC